MCKVPFAVFDLDGPAQRQRPAIVETERLGVKAITALHQRFLLPRPVLPVSVPLVITAGSPLSVPAWLAVMTLLWWTLLWWKERRRISERGPRP